VTTTLQAEQLLNRRVRATNGRVVGRIEELRVERRDDRYEVMEYVLGAGGLLERLAIVTRSFFGYRPRSLVARSDQIDLTHPNGPRLTCPAADLRRQEAPSA
jgi:hypothetical protein